MLPLTLNSELVHGLSDLRSTPCTSSALLCGRGRPSPGSRVPWLPGSFAPWEALEEGEGGQGMALNSFWSHLGAPSFWAQTTTVLASAEGPNSPDVIPVPPALFLRPWGRQQLPALIYTWAAPLSPVTCVTNSLC